MTTPKTEAGRAALAELEKAWDAYDDVMDDHGDPRQYAGPMAHRRGQERVETAVRYLALTQNEPTTPKTEAGRRFIKENGTSHIVLILAIEAEALSDALNSGRYLDLEGEDVVERLAKALDVNMGQLTAEHVATALRGVK